MEFQSQDRSCCVVCAECSCHIYVCLLPPPNGVAKVLFSVISVHQLFCPWGEGGVPVQEPSPGPLLLPGPEPLNIFKLVHYEKQTVRTVRKRLVGIRLKCFLFYILLSNISIHTVKALKCPVSDVSMKGR